MASFSKRGIYRRALVLPKGQDAIFRSFDSKAEAQMWARSIENAMDKGVYIDNSEAQSPTLFKAIKHCEKETIARKGYPSQELQRSKHRKTQPLGGGGSQRLKLQPPVVHT